MLSDDGEKLRPLRWWRIGEETGALTQSIKKRPDFRPAFHMRTKRLHPAVVAALATDNGQPMRRRRHTPFQPHTNDRILQFCTVNMSSAYANGSPPPVTSSGDKGARDYIVDKPI